MAKKIRGPGHYQPWPQAARPHYIRLFGLQERLRAFLMVGAELAETRRLEDYERQLLSPGGTLRRIYHFLKEAQKEIAKIKAVYEIGRPPKWYEIAVGLGDLTEDLSRKMPLIESGLREQNAEPVIKKTGEALKIALDIRILLLSLPLDQSEIGPDPLTGLEEITDRAEFYILDTVTWQLTPKGIR